MGIDWNKRLNSKPVAAPFVRKDVDSSLSGRVVAALFAFKPMLRVHAPLVTTVAEWFMATSDTPVAEVDAIDEVFVAADGMTASIKFWCDDGDKYTRHLVFTFSTDEEQIRVTRVQEGDMVRKVPLHLTGENASLQVLREFKWLGGE